MSNQHNPHSLPPKSTRLQFDPRQFWLILRLMSEDPRLLDLSDIVLVTLNTGIRPGELSKLRWADVDIPKNRMLIHSKARDRRCLPFGPKTLRILQARRVRNPASEFVLGESPARLLSRISWQFRALCDRVGVGPIPLRALRHRFFERLLSTGASIQSLLFLGGYRRTSLTIKCFLTDDQIYKQAVRDQARVEEQQ